MSISRMEGKKDYEDVIRGTQKRYPNASLVECVMMVFERFNIAPEDGRRYLSKQIVKEIEDEGSRIFTIKKEP